MKLTNKGLFEQLNEYGQSDYYPFHMPGHKRNPRFVNICTTDITEVEKFDNLHDPQGIIKEAMDRASEVYKSEETHLLVNGSTGGILSAIGACCRPGDHILTTRGCHKSVYNSMFINRLIPVFLYPEVDEKYGFYKGADPYVIEEKLANDDKISAVMIVSPTYEGIVSDIKGIAEVCHKYLVPLIVDEAHGAHFGFHEIFPKSSVQYADIVIHSVHKTLPSLTQTALLHAKGPFIDHSRLKYMLTCYQSSSPSYIFMAAIDKCIEFLKNSKEDFDKFSNRLDKFWKECEELKKLCLIKNDDPSRIVIGMRDGSPLGMEIYNRLYEDYHIQMEMVTPYYTIGISSVCDTDEGFRRLLEALQEIDKEIESIESVKPLAKAIMPERVCEAWEDAFNDKVEIPVMEAVGRVSASYVYLYPPGSPVLMPGEVVSEDAAKHLRMLFEKNFDIKGLKDGLIAVVR